ncbi:unnamed protein product [Cochlearia groenlandica]
MRDRDDVMGRIDLIKIKIKTMDSKTYILTVERTIPVLALKMHISNASWITPERQRLLSRGRVLNDDLRLSHYPPDPILTSQIYRVEVENKGYLVECCHDSNLGYSLQVIPNYVAIFNGFMRDLILDLANNNGNGQVLSEILSFRVEDSNQRISRFLRNEVLECLSNIRRLFVENVNVTDPLARRWHQGRVVVESGNIWEKLGRLLITLGSVMSIASTRETDKYVERDLFVSIAGQNSIEEDNSPPIEIVFVSTEYRNPRRPLHWQPLISEEHDPPSSPRLVTDEEELQIQKRRW